MNIDLHGASGIKVGVCQELTHSGGGAFWVRSITLTGRCMGVEGEITLTLYGEREDDLLLPHELDERVSLAERAAHDDREEAARPTGIYAVVGSVGKGQDAS